MVCEGKNCISVFLEVREKIWRLICEAVNTMNIAYFYDKFFHFIKKFLPLLTLLGLFRRNFTSNPIDVFNWYLLVNNMQFCKRLQICDKKRLKRKNCSWSFQRNRTPLAKRLSNTPFFIFRIRANILIESFSTKTEIHD